MQNLLRLLHLPWLEYRSNAKLYALGSRREFPHEGEPIILFPLSFFPYPFSLFRYPFSLIRSPLSVLPIPLQRPSQLLFPLYRLKQGFEIALAK